MHSTIYLRILKEVSIPAAFFVVGIVLWQLAIIVLKIPTFLLPSPQEVATVFMGKFVFLLEQLGVTLLEAGAGYALAFVMSFVFAALFVHSKIIERGLYPYAMALKITPVVALMPFFVLWFGLGFFSKVLVVALVCFFPLFLNILKGLKSVDPDMLELFHSFSATKAQIFFKLRVPSSLPFVFAGLKITTVLALTGAFVAEFVSGNNGIGYVIISSTRLLESATAFAAIAMAILGGVAFFLLVTILEKWVVFWQKVEGI